MCTNDKDRFGAPSNERWDVFEVMRQMRMTWVTQQGQRTASVRDKKAR
jgi:hypothetical protein